MSSNNDFELNTDIIHSDTTTYSSLLDLYGIDLFTNKHIAESKKKNEQLKMKEKNVLENIFLHKSQTQDMDKEYTSQLFQKPMVLTKQQEYSSQSMESNTVFIFGATIIGIIFVIVMGRYLKIHMHKNNMEERYE